MTVRRPASSPWTSASSSSPASPSVRRFRPSRPLGGGTPVGLNTSNLIGGYDNSTGITQIAYTWQFGNGVSASVAVEDNRVINRAPIFNGANASTAAQFFTGAYTNASGGQASPDFVGNVRIDQAAFTAQLSGGLHNIRANYYGATEPTGHPSDEWGFAIQGGLQLKNLPTGPGDKLSITAIYADGAPKYAINGTIRQQLRRVQQLGYLEPGVLPDVRCGRFA